VTFTAAGVCGITAGGSNSATYTMNSGTGTCSVIANQAGNGNYTAAPTVTKTVNATLASQTITFTTPAPPAAEFLGTFTVAPRAAQAATGRVLGGRGLGLHAVECDLHHDAKVGNCYVVANQTGTATTRGNAGDGDGSGEGWSSGSDCTNGDVYGRANQRSVLVKLLGLMTTQNNGVTPTSR